MTNVSSNKLKEHFPLVDVIKYPVDSIGLLCCCLISVALFLEPCKITAVCLFVCMFVCLVERYTTIVLTTVD